MLRRRAVGRAPRAVALLALVAVLGATDAPACLGPTGNPAGTCEDFGATCVASVNQCSGSLPYACSTGVCCEYAVALAEPPIAGTVYVEGNVVAPGENSVLAFRYQDGALHPTPLRYPTGGGGAADLDDTGVLDADQQLAINAAATLLFAVNQGSDSIAVFHVADDGRLSPVAGSPFPSGGVAPASLGVSGDILVVANKASDGVRKLAALAPNYTTFAIDSDGTLTPTGTTFPLQPGSSPTQVYVAPGGALVFTTEETGVLRGFSLSASGDLKEAPGSPLPLPDSLFEDGHRPKVVWAAGLAAAPREPILYTGIPNNDSIATLAFTSDGELSFVGGEADPNAVLPCWSVVSADGKLLYVANAASDNVSVWNTSTDPRAPRLLQTVALPGGGNPWGLRLDPTGALLFVITPRQLKQVPEGTGQLLHGLWTFPDGSLEPIDGSPVPLPVAKGTNSVGVAVVADR